VIDMPTRSPDVVNEHRITLGRWEREQIKALNEAKLIRDVGVGVGVAAVGVGGTYVAYRIGKSIYDWVDDGIGAGILKAITPDGADETIDVLNETDWLSGRKHQHPVEKIFWRVLGL
jgi:hypothetical protein